MLLQAKGCRASRFVKDYRQPEKAGRGRGSLGESYAAQQRTLCLPPFLPHQDGFDDEEHS